MRGGNRWWGRWLGPSIGDRPSIVAYGRLYASDPLWVPPSGLVEQLSDLDRCCFCIAVRACERGLLGQVGDSEKVSLVLLRHQPEVEVRRALHHRQVIDALDPCGRLDRRNEPV